MSAEEWRKEFKTEFLDLNFFCCDGPWCDDGSCTPYNGKKVEAFIARHIAAARAEERRRLLEKIVGTLPPRLSTNKELPKHSCWNDFLDHIQSRLQALYEAETK